MLGLVSTLSGLCVACFNVLLCGNSANLNYDINSLSWQPVFEYFRERTPRSYVEIRETSLLWSYKYAGRQNVLMK